MGRYGETALRAIRLLLDNGVATPEEAWEKAAAEVFPQSPSSQEKACPKGAFLGLCEEGLVRGVKAGDYTHSVENKKYAVRALELLARDPSLANDDQLLWARVLNGERKAPNSQMDVVLSLWTANLINLEMLESVQDGRDQEAVLRYSMQQAAKAAKENPY